MDTDRLLRELTDFLRIPSVSNQPIAQRGLPRGRRMGRRRPCVGSAAAKFSFSRAARTRWCGVSGPRCPARPRCSSTVTTTCSRPSRWTSGPRRRSSHGARRQACSRVARGRQGPGVLPAQGNRGARRPTARELPLSHRGEEEYGSRVLFELLRREPSAGEPTRAHRRHGLHRAAAGPRLHHAARLCYAEITVRTARSIYTRASSRRGAQRARRARSPARPLEDARRQGARPRPVCVGEASIESRARHLKRLPFREGEFLKHRVQAKALTGSRPTRAGAPLGPPDLRDPRHHRGFTGTVPRP